MSEYLLLIIIVFALAAVIVFLVHARHQRVLNDIRKTYEIQINEIKKRQERQLEDRTFDLRLLAKSLREKKEELEKINVIVKSINSEMNFVGFLNTILDQSKVIKGTVKVH